MDKSGLKKLLDYVDATRQKRTLMAERILENPEWIPILMQIIEEDQDPFSSKASWVLEFVVKKDLELVLPHLEKFSQFLAKISLDSSVRPVAKICELLSIQYFAQTSNPTQIHMTEKHLRKITEAAFDWVIGDHKVAAKAYSMTTLFLLGKKYHWIHPELKVVLMQNYTTGSAAYKARAGKILDQIKKMECS